MISLLNKYLFKHQLIALVFITFALTSAIWLTQAIRLLDLVIEDGAPLGEFLKVALLTLPTFLDLVLPLCFVGTIIFTYNRLALDSELVIFSAVGLSPAAIAKSALYLGVLVSVFCYALNLWISPLCKKELIISKNLLGTKYGSTLLSEDVFNDLGKDFTIYIRDRDSNGVMHGIMLNDRRDNKDVVILAESGQMVQGDTGDQIIIYNGMRQEVGKSPAQLNQLFFDKYTFDLKLFSKEGNFRLSKPSEIDTLTLWQRTEADIDPAYRSSLRSELHKRFATPFISISFALIVLSFLLGGEFNRRGQNQKILKSALAVICLQGASLIVLNMTKDNNSLIPLLYVVNIAPAFFGGFLLHRLGQTRTIPAAAQRQGDLA